MYIMVGSLEGWYTIEAETEACLALKMDNCILLLKSIVKFSGCKFEILALRC